MWNDDLAQIAQTHSERCQFAFNNDRENGPIFRSVGENLHINLGPTDYAASIQQWTSESTDYNAITGACSAICTAYSQVKLAISYSQSRSVNSFNPT